MESELNTIFCDNCGSLLFMRQNPDNEKELEKHCKNCNNRLDFDFKNKSLFSQNYKEDYQIERNIKNLELLQDPTLPRVTNIPCINEHCITNKTDLTKYSVFIKSNEPEFTVDNVVKFKTETTIDIFHINNYSFVAYFRTEEERNEYKEFMIDSFEKYNVENFVRPERQIVFMKYDPTNLLYLYICSSCMSSWTNK